MIQNTYSLFFYGIVCWTLVNWIGMISHDYRYIREGMRLSVIGMLSKKNGDAMILPPPEPLSTGFVLLSCLLPSYFDGIVLRLVDRSYFVPNSGVSWRAVRTRWDVTANNSCAVPLPLGVFFLYGSTFFFFLLLGLDHVVLFR